MNSEVDILKGIHPGFVLERKIQEQHLKKGQLALSVREYPQTLSSITKGKRDMNIALALKLEKALGLQEGYFMVLQVYFDIAKEKKRQSNKPNLSKLRRILFWDTRMDLIDWNKHARYVIHRVFERGNETEKKEITRFYGSERVNEIISTSKQ
jgi:plasmid maintenance system antidote protein VapI